MARTGPEQRQHLPRKRPLQQRSAFTVEAILEAAVRILLADGYPALTTRTVADRAGVSVGSLYQYFPDKQAIVAALIRRHVEDVMRALEAAPVLRGTGLEANVRSVMVALVACKRRHHAMSQALKEPMAEVQGRAIVMEAARGLVPVLAEKLGPELGRDWQTGDTVHLGLAIASVEGALFEVVERNPEAMMADATIDLLTRVFLAAFETSKVA